MPDKMQMTPHSLQVYLGYRRLTTHSLGRFLSELGSVADISVRIYADTFALSPEGLPTLEVQAAHTDDSIKFTFGEGLLPSVTTDEQHDIVINIPKKLGIPLLVGYLLLNGASQALNVRNAYLDGRIKELDIQLKESEIRKALEKSPSVAQEVQHQATEVVDAIMRDKDYLKFVIYDIDVLQIPGGRESGRSQRRDEEN